MKLGDPKIVGELLRERRRKMGYSIEQFAQLTGVSPITIMRIELGRVGYVHAKTAKALEVPKKITKSMVMVPTAVMQDGERVPLPPLSAMLHKPVANTNAVSTGEREATIPNEPPAALKPIKRSVGKLVVTKIPAPIMKAEELGQPEGKTMRKRFLGWLSHEFGRMAQE